MHCRDCPRFDQEAQRCQDGKVNPPRWETAVDVANVIGVRSICVFNDYRERLLETRKSSAAGASSRSVGRRRVR
ncbi:MAG: hypothetical protein ACOCX1_01230 [Fimbriimonadaceae bacterium]